MKTTVLSLLILGCCIALGSALSPLLTREVLSWDINSEDSTKEKPYGGPLLFPTSPRIGQPIEDIESLHENEQDVYSETGVENTYHPVVSRIKRQIARDRAIDLALNHQDRGVGNLHGRVDLRASGNDARNYHAQGGLGLGSVLWRSNDNRHSLGAGAYVGQGRGRFDGFRYKTRLDSGVGLGYQFRF